MAGLDEIKKEIKNEELFNARSHFADKAGAIKTLKL
jgi:hypothetical protein